MAFSKNLFLVLFAIATVTSYQLNAMESDKYEIPWNFTIKLNAMESKAMMAMLEGSAASDVQVYQLLSFVEESNNEFYLPKELIQIIAINAHKITEQLCMWCYKRDGSCVEYPINSLNLIRRGLYQSVSHTMIANTLKTCLSYCGKSLSEVQDSNGSTVLHRLFCIEDTYHLNCVKIICLVMREQIWDLIKVRSDNNSGFASVDTVLHYPDRVSAVIINELLKTAPSPEEAWKLINEKNDIGETPLSLAAQSTPCSLDTKQQKKEIIKIFESYRPKEQ